jgi:hypothetical protein
MIIATIRKLAWVTAIVLVASASITACSGSAPKGTSDLPVKVTLRQIDGGPHYFANLDPAAAWMDSHILLGAWYEEPRTAAEVGYDVAMGNNMYWDLAGEADNAADRVGYNVIRKAGMHACVPDRGSQTGSESLCSFGYDELDMKIGPTAAGYGKAAGAFNKPVIPSTVVYQNYGKGVLFSANNCHGCWETAIAAAKWLKYSDILSADSYWMTDPDLNSFSQGGCALLPNSRTACTNGNSSVGLTNAQRALPANYAYNVTHLEQLQAMNGPSKPVIVPVETGCPGSACVDVAQFTASAWHAIIAGARGILWFQHNFGKCYDDNTFYDGADPGSPMRNCQVTPGETLADLVAGVTAFNKEVTSLNAVLLSPFADGYVSTSADVSVMAKDDGGQFYVFAASGKPATPPTDGLHATFALASSYTGPVTVIGENRTIQAENGQFTDTFANENSVHIYRIGG